MMVAALSTAGFSQYISASSNVSGSQQALQSLEASLAEGNLNVAQIAFKAYGQLNPAASTSSAASSSSATQLAQDTTALGSALGSGNLTTARSAFAAMQGDLKTSPPQAIANAVSAAAQTVQWIDDLLTLYNLTGSAASTNPVDPYTSMLNSALGLYSSTSTANPLVTLLESKYGTGSTANTSGAINAISAAGSGNVGSSASVNAYA